LAAVGANGTEGDAMRIKSGIKSGRITTNHNAKAVREPGVKVKSKVRAGRLVTNHNARLA
jgi:hypothetical protein